MVGWVDLFNQKQRKISLETFFILLKCISLMISKLLLHWLYCHGQWNDLELYDCNSGYNSKTKQTHWKPKLRWVSRKDALVLEGLVETTSVDLKPQYYILKSGLWTITLTTDDQIKKSKISKDTKENLSTGSGRRMSWMSLSEVITGLFKTEMIFLMILWGLEVT